MANIPFLNNAYFTSKVGIGIDSPDYPLHISSILGYPLLIERTNSGDAGIRFKDANTTDADSVRIGAIGDAFRVFTNGSEKMRIDSDGDVGIGTDDPLRKLNVASGNFQIVALFENTSTNSARISLSNANTTSDSKVGIGAITDDLALYAGGTRKVYINSVGDVGIGTDDPYGKLGVNGNVTVGINPTSPGQSDVYGYLQVNQQTDTATSGLSILNSLVTRTLRLWVDGSDVSILDSGATGTGLLALNTGGGNVGIGLTAPTSKLHVKQNVTDPDLDQPDSFAVLIDSNHSGSTATTGDREQGALFIDVDSSTTGGGTGDEHRLYGVRSDVRYTGDSDHVVAGNFFAEQNTSAGTTTHLRGVSASISSDGGASASLTNAAGIDSSVSMQDATPVVNSYGGTFLNLSTASRTALTSNSYGIKSEIQIDSTSSFTNLYAGHFSIDSNAAYTATNAYLLYLDYAGASLATNTYSIYSPDDVKSYHAGKFGIGTEEPSQALEVHGTVKIGETGVVGGILISGDSMMFQIDSDNSTSASSYRFRKDGTADDGTELMRIQENGRVGIATDDPGALLEISGIRENQIRLSSYDITVAGDEKIGGIEFYSNDTNNEGVKGSIGVYTTDSNSAGYMTFSTSTNVEKMRIAASGLITISNKITGLTAGTSNLDAVNVQQLNNATTGVLTYKGTWDARTLAQGGLTGDGGNPNLRLAANKVEGDYYICNVAGSATPNGASTEPSEWAVGDWCIFTDADGTDQWQKLDNSSVLDGAGTGGNLAAWSGTGTSVTLQNAPVTYSGNDVTIPSGDLTVEGDVVIPQDSYLYFEGDQDDALNRIGRSSGENATLLTARKNIGIIIDSNDDDTDGAFTVGHNGTTLAGSTNLFKVQGDGKVGINKDPLAILDSVGSVNGNWAGRFENTHTGGLGILVAIAGTGVANRIFQARTGSTNVMTITGNKRVGIGTDTPLQDLHINDDVGNANIYLSGSASLTNEDYQIGQAISGVTQGGFSIRNISEAKDVMVFADVTGNCGISTSTPQAKLDVAGGIRMGDDATAASSTNVGTQRYRVGTEYVEVTGAELVTNGDFATDTDWNKGTGWTISGGTAICNGTQTAYSSITQDIGTSANNKYYRVKFTVSNYTAGLARPWIGGNNIGSNISSNGEYNQVIQAASANTNGTLYVEGDPDFIATVDNVSVIEVVQQNASYVDMCMQVSSTEYEWINITQNNWI